MGVLVDSWGRLGIFFSLFEELGIFVLWGQDKLHCHITVYLWAGWAYYWVFVGRVSSFWVFWGRVGVLLCICGQGGHMTRYLWEG